MDQAAGRKMMEIQQLAAELPDYQALLEEYRQLDARFLEVRESMAAEARNVTDDYMGLCWEMQRFLLELACREV